MDLSLCIANGRKNSRHRKHWLWTNWFIFSRLAVLMSRHSISSAPPVASTLPRTYLETLDDTVKPAALKANLSKHQRQKDQRNTMSPNIPTMKIFTGTEIRYADTRQVKVRPLPWVALLKLEVTVTFDFLLWSFPSNTLFFVVTALMSRSYWKSVWQTWPSTGW